MTEARWLVSVVVAWGCTLGCGSGRGAVSHPVEGEAPPTPQGRFGDQTPSHVPPSALDCVVLLYEPKRRLLASATVIRPTSLLTAAHVIDDLPRDAQGRIALNVDGVDLVLGVRGEGLPDAPHGDWAWLERQEGRWTHVAAVHPRALDPEWSPQPGTEVLLAGYALGFFSGAHVDLTAPTPSVRARIEGVNPADLCWFATGEALDLGGMSGGPAMVWSEARQRLELIGLFRGTTGTTTTTTTARRWLGLDLGSKSDEARGLAYTVHRLPAAPWSARP